jgi:hypothetical protein
MGGLNQVHHEPSHCDVLSDVLNYSNANIVRRNSQFICCTDYIYGTKLCDIDIFRRYYSNYITIT